MKIGIGIDTGGTCTDAVVYDFEQKKVLAAAKSLTTKQQLEIGIENSLNKLPEELVRQAEIVALSTTLATNACVEGKGGKAKLVLFGGDEEFVMRAGMEFGTYGKEDLICYETETTYTGTVKREPDWDEFARMLHETCKDCDAMAAAEVYAKQTGSVLERKAAEIIERELDVPMVCGYELFHDMNFLKRGASALLNAQLVPLISQFLKAVGKALEEKGLDIPIVIVRSDGTLMSREFTRYHPIETLLCGPVASVMGARELTDSPNAVVVDMGGTTTDIAFLRRGVPMQAKDGVRVGNWETFVKGVYVDTFGLGGDSAVRFANDAMYLDEERVIPLCTLASEYPVVTEELKKLAQSDRIHTRWIHEYFVLQKDIEDRQDYDENERKLCRALKERPLSLEQAASLLGTQPYHLNTRRLEKDGVVLRSGLTPTDIMHIRGDYTSYCTEASLYAAEFVARCLFVEREALEEMIYDEVKHKLYVNLARILLERQYLKVAKLRVGEQLQEIIEERWTAFKTGGKAVRQDDFVEIDFHAPGVFVGVGGPTRIFLPEVARMFHARAVIPEHAEVANAVGAVVGKIAFTVNVFVTPHYKAGGKDYYTLFYTGASRRYPVPQFEKALADGRVKLRELAEAEAARRGIRGVPKIVVEETEKFYVGTAMQEDVVLTAYVEDAGENCTHGIH